MFADLSQFEVGRPRAALTAAHAFAYAARTIRMN